MKLRPKICTLYQKHFDNPKYPFNDVCSAKILTPQTREIFNVDKWKRDNNGNMIIDNSGNKIAIKFSPRCRVCQNTENNIRLKLENEIDNNWNNFIYNFNEFDEIGFIYINDLFKTDGEAYNHWKKIGCTENIFEREKKLNKEGTMNPAYKSKAKLKNKIIKFWEVYDYKKVEHILHTRFKKRRVKNININKIKTLTEWIKDPKETLINEVNEIICNKLKIEVK